MTAWNPKHIMKVSTNKMPCACIDCFFYMVSNTTDDAMPLGPTKKYALLLGNVVDNPEIKVV